MANLRIVSVTAIDSTTITATFTENLNEDIGTANVTITSQTAGVPDSAVLVVSIVGNELTVTCQPLIPLAAYFVTFFSTSTQLFNSLNGNATILNDGVTNRQLIIAPLDSNNPVQTYLTNFLRNNVYNLEPTSIISSWIQVLSTSLSKALYDIRQSGNENYLSFTVVDESQTRGPGPFDRLNEEGAYEVLRVGLAPTNAPTQSITPIASFPSYPVSLFATSNIEKLTPSSQDTVGTFNLDDFTINLRKQFVIILNSVTFLYSSSLSAYVYDIQKYGYQILTSVYDPDFAFTYLQLKNNQIMLSSKILNDPLFSTENIVSVQVSYQYKDTGKIIDPASLVVDTVIPSGREIVLDVFAHQPDRNLIHRIPHAAQHGAPPAEIARPAVQLEQPHHHFVHAFFGKHQRHLVDRRHIPRRHHRARVHVAEQRDLIFHSRADGALRAAQQNIGLNTDAAQLFHAVLGGLGFQLLGGGDPGHQRHMHEHAVVAPLLMAHLADGFHKRQRLDVAHGAADLHDHHVHVGRDFAHGGFDLVGHVRDHLYGLAQIIAAPLARNDLLVDAAGCEVIRLRQLGVREALVMAQVQVGFGAIVGDEDFAMLEGAHGAGIHVQIGVEFLQRDVSRGSPAGIRWMPPQYPCPTKRPRRRS